MCVMWFVLDVSMMRESEGDSNAGVGDGGVFYYMCIFDFKYILLFLNLTCMQ